MNRILMMSNDPILKRKSVDALSHAGFKVTDVTGALDGLVMVNRDGFSAIIIDEELADIDGYRACEKIRQYSQVPVILLGTESLKNALAKVNKSGFTMYLEKPISPGELVDRVQSVLKGVQIEEKPKPPQILNLSELPETQGAPVQEPQPISLDKMVTLEEVARAKRPSGVDKVTETHPVSNNTSPVNVDHVPAESIGAIAVDLERQASIIKTAIARISQMQKRIAEAKIYFHQEQRDLQLAEDHLQEINELFKKHSGYL